MRQWLPKRSTYLGRILCTEGNELKTCTCQKPARWRCLCCLGRPMYCRGCCRISHGKLIYHRLQKWTGLFFQDAGLWEVGVRLCVGHMGDNCPSQETLLEACRSLEDEKDRADDQTHENSFASVSPEQYDVPDYIGDDNPDDPDYVGDDDPDDPEWQDVPPSQSDPLRTPTPAADELDIEHLLLVDASGLISLPTIWCACEAAEHKPDEDLLDLQLYPVSYIKTKTVFSFRCLDDYRLSNLECKTSAYQYYQKLRRLTNPALPQSVANRYNEFRRATRQWRNLKLRKWFGFGHRMMSPTKGSMALFCAACPQPGVNLPADHKTRYTS
jgi:hypothetical protein